MTLTVLVTGGCGFIGTPLIRQLVQVGHRVIAYDDLSRGSTAGLGSTAAEIQLIQGDVRNLDQLKRTLTRHKAEVVVHLAALHFIPDCDRNPEQCLSTNTLGTQILLEAAADCPSLQGIVFSSTAAVYEPSSLPHHEGSRLAPNDVYGYSKLAAEQLVAAFGARTSISIGVARLFNVYGPGETNPHLIPSVILQALRGSTLALGDLTTSRDYVFTEDVADGLGRLVGAVATGQTLTCNLGTGESRTGEEVVRAIAEVMDITPRVEVDSSRLRASERPILCADIANAGQSLGWSPEITFQEGLRAALTRPMQGGNGV